jgi:hypothetical protein
MMANHGLGDTFLGVKVPFPGLVITFGSFGDGDVEDRKSSVILIGGRPLAIQMPITDAKYVRSTNWVANGEICAQTDGRNIEDVTVCILNCN